MGRHMQSFIEFVTEQERIAEMPGVYAAAHAKFNDSKRVKALIKGITGEMPEKLHCTITYSRRHVPVENVQPILDMWDPKQVEKCRAVRVEAFGNPSATKPGQPPVNALVLVLDAQLLEAMHKATIDMGCSFDYNEYHPHVTLLYGVPANEAAAACKVIQEALDAEPLTVTLSAPYIEPLKAD